VQEEKNMQGMAAREAFGEMQARHITEPHADSIVPAARIITSQSCYSTIVGGIEIRDPGTLKSTEGLPPKQKDMNVIVSPITAHMVAGVMSDRTDVVYQAIGAPQGSNGGTAGTISARRRVRTA
jgi:hypothetical protein